MKDYARKQSSDKRFPDLMHTTTERAIWNNVIESDPSYSEFNAPSGSSPRSRAYDQYMRQSEFKKPWRFDGRFPDMESDWTGPPGIPVGPFDQPWNLQIPFDPTETTHTVFYAQYEGGWCEDDVQEIVISGTHPIYELQIVFDPSGGQFIANVRGYGTNQVIFDLYVPAGTFGFVTVIVYMLSYQNVSGYTNVNISEGDNCCQPVTYRQARPSGGLSTPPRGQDLSSTANSGQYGGSVSNAWLGVRNLEKLTILSWNDAIASATYLEQISSGKTYFNVERGHMGFKVPAVSTVTYTGGTIYFHAQAITHDGADVNIVFSYAPLLIRGTIVHPLGYTDLQRWNNYSYEIAAPIAIASNVGYQSYSVTLNSSGVALVNGYTSIGKDIQFAVNEYNHDFLNQIEGISTGQYKRFCIVAAPSNVTSSSAPRIVMEC